MINAIELSQQLIRFASVTPDQAGCLDYIAGLLCELGFTCTRLPFGAVDNLYARRGTSGPNFCFAGHVDVVPTGEAENWQYHPFAGVINDNILYGRGIVDMKGAIAAFISAVNQLPKDLPGSISLLLTSDEEGPAQQGTVKVVEWLKQTGEIIDACLVGEPTNPSFVGEMVKVGRRGSLNATISIHGTAGHVAYPEQAANPIPKLLELLQKFNNYSLDAGYDYFDPSHLEITSIDVGNPTSNVIPAKAQAKLNIRFNPHHSGSSLKKWLEDISRPYNSETEIKISGEPFLCRDDSLMTLLADSITQVCDSPPLFSTSGGTSDARFIKDICPTIEFGLVNKTAHHTDEHIHIDEITKLEKIYQTILINYFDRFI